MDSISSSATSESLDTDSKSHTSDAEDYDVGVGLSDPIQSENRRKLLDLINRLHSTGVQRDIDLPMIAVIGSQSAGKSSLIESISGITLPRSTGTCTRCPTECRLSYSTQPWQCIVSLRFTVGKDGLPLGNASNIIFGDTITDKSKVEERLRRAQRAILNPSTAANSFLAGAGRGARGSELSFSTNCVSLQISGRDLTDLSFCDLPGLIASVGDGGHTSDIELVKSLVTTYISKPSCLILLTVTCETDFENQGAHHLAKQYDPEGQRTIGVLTKPDRIPSGEEDNWLKFINNDAETLANGWFSVKQPNSQALLKGISWAEAREQERRFFSSTAPWSTVEPSCQRQLGTQNLTERLSLILSDLIKRRLPELHEELQTLLKQTGERLRGLPSPPSKDPVSQVIHLVANFTRDLARYIEGTPEGDGILQSIQPFQDEFKKAIRATAPDFRPYTRTSSGHSDFVSPAFLSNEEATTPASSSRNHIFLDDVMNQALQAKTRELPDNYPFVVTRILIKDVTNQWDGPSHMLFEKTSRLLVEFVKKVAASHFGQYPKLHQAVIIIVNDFVEKCNEATLKYINWLLKVEQAVFTLNDHYYSDYRDKFLAHYRSCRQKGAKKSFVQRLENSTAPNLSGLALPSDTSMAKALSGLNELGMDGVKPADLAKLFSADQYEPAIQIMASVRAYFQVAYKRFVDNVPMAIDQELLRGLDWDRGIEAALLKGLGVGSPDGHQRCKNLLQEPQSVLHGREDLLKKQERLNTAKRQLMSLF